MRIASPDLSGLPTTTLRRAAALVGAIAAATLVAVTATPASAATTLLPFGSTWNYLDDGSDQGSAWTAPAFDDSAWASGPARLGYGDANVVTTVGYGPDSGAKYPTTYFRAEFDVTDPGDFTGVLLRLVRDDGAVVYLNGAEVFRSNMPAGAIDYLTVAAASVGGADETAAFEALIGTGDLVAGTNVVAVEVHQRSGTSSDLGLDLEVVGLDGNAAITRGPYLQRVGETSAVVRWRTDAPTDSRVWYGDAPANLVSFADGDAGTTEHEVALGALAPGTTYFYAVGDGANVLAGDDADHFFTTNPLAGDPVDLRVWVLGDSGTADASAESVRNAWRGFAAADPADLMVLLGDNAYETGTDNEYQAAVFDMYADELRTTPLWPALGNHDAGSADSPTESGVYYDIFTLPRMAEAGGTSSGTEAYYSFDYGDVHFVCLDSHDTDRDPSGAMLTWLVADLAATDARWLVAFWHHPPYSDGSHDSDVEARLIEMRQNVLPILEDYGVDLVLSGHSHSYERSVLIDGFYGHSSTLAPYMILDAGDGDPGGDGAYVKSALRSAHEGAVYAVAGSSGKTSSASLSHPIMLVSLEELGSLALDITDEAMDVTFLEASGIAADHFRITKSAVAVCGNGLWEPGEDCDDGNTQGGDCCPSDCSFAYGCAPAAKATVSVRHDAGDPSRDRLLWKWNGAAAVDAAAFGAPDVDTDARLCLYDEVGGVPQLAAAVEAAAGPAWKGDSLKAWLYGDRDGASAGVRKVKLSGASAARPKVLWKASGAAMNLPAAALAERYFAQDPRVRVQLVNDAGGCWSSSFVGADSRNGPESFRAKVR